jgi:glycosyltransferase involved in cell wall biosynthesis
LNILFLDQFSEPGGAQLCLKDLMPEIQRRSWNPHLMAPGDGGLVEWSREAGIPVYPLPLRSYSNGRKTALDFLRFSVDAPRMALALRRVIQRHRVDLVYVNGPRVLPAVAGVSCPVIFHAHSFVGRRVERRLIDWTLRSTNAAVIGASEFVADPCRRAVNPQRVHVIYNGIPDLDRGARKLDRRPTRIGIIGRIAPEKGHLDFVEAAQQISGEGEYAEFFVYGDKLFADAGYDARVRAMARNTPVTFCGWTDDIAKALHDLEILAVPSGSHEAATRVILEAFSAGTPVVAYRSGGIPEIVDEKRTGILTASPDAESLAKSIRFLMEDPALMERLASAGRREWQRRFRIEQFRTSICDLIESHTRSFAGVRRRFS